MLLCSALDRQKSLNVQLLNRGNTNVLSQHVDHCTAKRHYCKKYRDIESCAWLRNVNGSHNTSCRGCGSSILRILTALSVYSQSTETTHEWATTTSVGVSPGPVRRFHHTVFHRRFYGYSCVAVEPYTSQYRYVTNALRRIELSISTAFGRRRHQHNAV